MNFSVFFWGRGVFIFIINFYLWRVMLIFPFPGSQKDLF